MPYAQTGVNDSALAPSQTDSDGPNLRDRSHPEVLEPDHGICGFRGASLLSHQIHEYEHVGYHHCPLSKHLYKRDRDDELLLVTPQPRLGEASMWIHDLFPSRIPIALAHQASASHSIAGDP